jgi:hypothetical protein
MGVRGGSNSRTAFPARKSAEAGWEAGLRRRRDSGKSKFDFTVNRKRDGPERFLTNYRGYLHADAFSGYDGLYLPDLRTAAARITEVACNAHARRKFYEARGSDALRSHQALAYYRQLYELERQAKDFSDAQRLQMRQDLAVPILG